jgi:toxin ParE1/3/4
LKRFEVLLTGDAVRDLEEIFEYIAERDDPSKAGHVLDRIEDVLQSLATFPERGSHPKELLQLGIRDYRQTYFKPYRVIYRVVGQRVYLIVDGRRDLQTLLARRLLER